MSELKPCPFCGGKAQAEVIQWGEVVNASIYCTRCGVGIHRNDQNGALDAAIAAWNTRHEETCEVKEIETIAQTLSMASWLSWGECSECGCLTPVDSTFCIHCGRKVQP